MNIASKKRTVYNVQGVNMVNYQSVVPNVMVVSCANMNGYIGNVLNVVHPNYSFNVSAIYVVNIPQKTESVAHLVFVLNAIKQLSNVLNTK